MRAPEGANWMECYATGNYSRDELLTDFVALRVVEKLAPDLARSDRSYASAIGSHIHSSHKSLSEYHSAISDINRFLDEMVAASNGTVLDIDHDAGSLPADPVMGEEDSIFGYAPIEDMLNTTPKDTEDTARRQTEILGLDPDNEADLLMGRAYATIYQFGRIAAEMSDGSPMRDWGYTTHEMQSEASGLAKRTLKILNEHWKVEKPKIDSPERQDDLLDKLFREAEA